MATEVRIMVIFGSEHKGDYRVVNVLYLDLGGNFMVFFMRIIELYTYINVFVCM